MTAVAALLLAGGCATAQPATVPASRDWPLPADPSAAAAQAGLPMLGEEMLAVHYHAHLDIIIRGGQIQVPAHVGIDAARHRISPLHTHDTTGIVHIESGADIPFTLGQFFTEWGQPLSAAQVGPVTAGSGEVLRVYRDGAEVTGDPATLTLKAHDEIVVWLGPAGEQPRVPTEFRFPAGL